MPKGVYIVEDIGWLRDMLARYLAMQPGLEVRGTAGSAEEALAALPAGADVVTVDLSLDVELHGLQLVRTIHERWPDLPCVVLSGRPAITMEAAARAAGAEAYVEKGDDERLLGTLYALVGLPDPSAP